MFGVVEYDIEGKLVGNTKYLSTEEIYVKLDNVDKKLKITGICKGKKYSLTAMYNDISGTIEALIQVNDKKLANAKIDLKYSTNTLRLKAVKLY